MANETERSGPDGPIEAPRESGWVRFVSYVKRKRDERTSKKKNESPTDKAARRTAVATVWMAIFTFVLAATSGFTIWILKNQLREMHEGGIDTHDLAVAAGKQADRTKDLVDRMKDQADRTKEMVEQATIQAKASQQLAQNAVDTLRNTQKSFREDQRAWVGIGDMQVVQFDESKPLKVIINYFNSGKSPARNVRESGLYRLTRNPIEGPNPSDIRNLAFGFKPANSVPPQGKYYLTFPFTADAKNPFVEEYAVLKSKLVLVYFFGEVQYDDVSGRTHTTTFCTYLSDPDAKTMTFCSRFNEMD